MSSPIILLRLDVIGGGIENTHVEGFDEDTPSAKYLAMTPYMMLSRDGGILKRYDRSLFQLLHEVLLITFLNICREKFRFHWLKIQDLHVQQKSIY